MNAELALQKGAEVRMLARVLARLPTLPRGGCKYHPPLVPYCVMTDMYVQLLSSIVNPEKVRTLPLARTLSGQIGVSGIH